MKIFPPQTIEGGCYDDVLKGAVTAVMNLGHPIIGTKEILMPRQVIYYPINRYCINFERKHDILALLAETVWVLAGSSDVHWLKQYLPRAMDFSDDGETWRAGYGARLRWWKSRLPNMYTDQFSVILDELKKNRDSRQGIMTIWDPDLDPSMFGKTKDEPCNNWLHLIIRDDLLHINVQIRSNDLIWGNMINFFEWSVLQEVFAGILKTGVGTLCINQTSLHIYERHFDRARKIIQQNPKPNLDVDPMSNFDFKDLGEFDRVNSALYDMGRIPEFPPDGIVDNYTEVLDSLLDSHLGYVSTMAWFLTRTKNRDFNKVVNSKLNPFKESLHKDLITNLDKSFINTLLVP